MKTIVKKVGVILFGVASLVAGLVGKAVIDASREPVLLLGTKACTAHVLDESYPVSIEDNGFSFTLNSGSMIVDSGNLDWHSKDSLYMGVDQFNRTFLHNTNNDTYIIGNGSNRIYINNCMVTKSH